MTAMNCRAICLRALLLGAFHLAAPMALLASPSVSYTHMTLPTKA